MPDPTTASTPARDPGIDVLRGLSILLVVFHHVGLRIPINQGLLARFVPEQLLDALIFNGYRGVFIFFVISGFLITSNSLARWGSLGAMDWRAFYARRAARIFPSLIFLVAILSLLHLMGFSDYVIDTSRQSLGGAVFSALGLHLNWYEGRTGYLPGNWDVLWSLSIEEVFYIGFPLLCLGLRRDWLFAAVLCLLALSLPFSRAALEGNDIWQEKAYLPGMAGIAAGALSALFLAHFSPTSRWVPRLFQGVGVLGIFSALCLKHLLRPYLGYGSMLLLTLSTSSLLISLRWRRTGGLTSDFPGTRWLQSFGRLSYEIYLTHMFVVWPIVRAFKASGQDASFGIVWYVPATLISWLLGWSVARFVSVPAESAVRRGLLGTHPTIETSLSSTCSGP